MNGAEPPRVSTKPTHGTGRALPPALPGRKGQQEAPWKDQGSWLSVPGGANESERHLHPPPGSTLPPSLPREAAPPWDAAHPLPLKSFDRLAKAQPAQEGLAAHSLCRAAAQLWVCSSLALFQMPTGDLKVLPSQQHMPAPNLGKANPMRYRQGGTLVLKVCWN